MSFDQAIQDLGNGRIEDRLLQQREGVHRIVVVDAPRHERACGSI